MNIQVAELDQVSLPEIAEGEILSLQCKKFSGASMNRFARNLTDLKINTDPNNTSQEPQYCRVLKLKGESVKAVSAFFVIKFFDPTGILGQKDDTLVFTQLGPITNSLTKPIFRRQTIQNPQDSEIYLRIPKIITTKAETKTWSYTYNWNPNLFISISGGTQIKSEDENYYVLQLKAQEPAVLTYTLWATFVCKQNIVSLALAASGPVPQIATIDIDFKNILAEWDLPTVFFKSYASPTEKPGRSGNNTISTTICHYR